MTKKITNEYNPHLQNLIPGVLPVDQKTYDSLSWFVTKELWEKLDNNFVQKVGMILDDPKYQYDKDLTMTKMLLRHFLPTLKKKLHISKKNPLYTRITSQELILQENGEDVQEESMPITTNPLTLDRLIQQQLNLYRSNEAYSLVQILQNPEDKNIENDAQFADSLQTRKSIVATILTFLLLEDEHPRKK